MLPMCLKAPRELRKQIKREAPNSAQTCAQKKNNNRTEGTQLERSCRPVERKQRKRSFSLCASVQRSFQPHLTDVTQARDSAEGAEATIESSDRKPSRGSRACQQSRSQNCDRHKATTKTQKAVEQNIKKKVCKKMRITSWMLAKSFSLTYVSRSLFCFPFQCLFHNFNNQSSAT